MKATLQILLLVAIVALGYWLYILFATPLAFEEVRSEREQAVTERLKDIRTAQRAFRAKYGKFTASFDDLINFVNNDSMQVVIMTGSEYDSADIRAGRVKREVSWMRYSDTLFNHKGTAFQVENLRFIPFSDKGTGVFKPFQMDTTTIITESKVAVPVFQAYAPYSEFLGDLDQQELVNYRDIKVKTLGRADGLMVGSLVTANNEAGNWE